MTYGLPTRGQRDWDDELNNSVESLRAEAQTATAASEQARSNATEAIAIAQAAQARVGAVSGLTGEDDAVALLLGDDVSETASAADARTEGKVAADVANPASAIGAALSATIATQTEADFGQPIDTARRGGVRVEAITLTGPDFGTSGADITGYQRNATISGDFSAMGGPSPGQVFGNNDFTVLDDTTGATSVYGSLMEVAVTAAAGTVTNVYGSFSEVSLFGAGAGATITTAISHRVGSPKKKDGATGGAITSAISLYCEGPTDGGSNYAAWFDGNSRVVGRLELGDHIVSTSGTMRLRGDYTTGSYVEVASVAAGGNLTAKLGAGSSIFAVNNHDGADGGVVFYVDNSGNAYIKTSTGLKNIVVGAADSGGAGFRTLTVAN